MQTNCKKAGETILYQIKQSSRQVFPDTERD